MGGESPTPPVQYPTLCNRTQQSLLFANDINLLNLSHSVKKMNKQVDYDLKNLSNWINGRKICLNISKTEVVLFNSLKKPTDSDLHLKLNGKRLSPKDSVKYLGIKLDNNLT